MNAISVLLVDDSASQRAIISHRLRAAGYDVEVANDGNECLRVIGELRPDIVLLDVVMPGIDGWETLDAIRSSSGVPVIMLTARAEEIDRVRGLRAGADDYLGKPFQQDELEARIDAVMRRAELGRRDGLTGLPNRRTFDEYIDSMFAPGSQTGLPFALVLLDIDHFKRVNDTQGHAAGDQVLRDLATVAVRQLRAGEQVFRIGGEEFAVVVHGDRNAGVIVAERLRTAVESESRSPRLPTISAGVAAFPQDAHTREQLFHQADQALYAAKEAGRNTVSLAA
ncbi:MAG: two-component system, OmpR family, response regulator RpaB [Gaiellales bacterium]|jgi:diguanylate cyclase (GGDEF)-like protein|nr:two-component system, OmpR family, response regulator RpaB [Gaiellales bacterium]